VGEWPALVTVDVGDELVGEAAADASTRDQAGTLDGVAALGETPWLGEVAEARLAFGTAGA
jgi:hypothetical protein